MPTSLMDLLPVFPEIFLAIVSMLLLVVGVYWKKPRIKIFSYVAVIMLLTTAILMMSFPFTYHATLFHDSFIMDGYAKLLKILVLVGAAASVILSVSYLEKEKLELFEFPVLIMLATVGMMMMISANDIMTLYVGLELQSLSLYVLAAIKRNDVRASEAGVKYFVLGALASAMLLYGASLVYGFSGTTNFYILADTLITADQYSTGLVVGLIFMMVGIAFKVSAVPFHMWTPDVYEGSPTPVTAFFAIAPKIAAIGMMTRLLIGAFGDLTDQWQQIVMIMSIGSMIVGSIGAVIQTNIKRLMAYSSIGHMGYAMMGLVVGAYDGVWSMLVYLSIYMVMTIGAFAVILCMRRKECLVEKIEDLAGLSRTNGKLALIMAIMMFSMSGIPPLAGFFGKLFIFKAAIDAQYYTIAIIGVLTSVIAAYYYLRVIKVMYFDEPAEMLDPEFSNSHHVVMYLATAVILFFVVLPSPILDVAKKASTGLIVSIERPTY